VGAIALGAGITVLAVRNAKGARKAGGVSPSVTPWIGGGGAGLRGSF
jgi:hypothetical protein